MRTLAVVLVLGACASHSSAPPEKAPPPAGQSFHDGVQALCELPDHVPDTGEPYNKRLAAAGTWASANITNPEAKKIGDVGSLAGSRDQLAAAVKTAGVTSCKLLDNGMALQSFADGMKVLCDASSSHDAAYFKGHLLNPEVITMVGAMGDLSPADRAIRMRDAIAKAGLASCARFDHTPDPMLAHAPKVTGAGFTEVDAGVSVLTATETGVAVEGKSIVAIRDGAVDPAELEGGALGIAIPRVREFLKALAAQQPTPRLQFLVDPKLPYKLLVQLIFTAKQAGFIEPQIIVSVGGAAKTLPITLPAGKPKSTGIRPVVAIASGKLLLWSISGKEGTLKQPKVTATSAADIGKALAEIVARRWSTGKRADEDRTILVMADGSVSMQAVADVLAVVRATADGKELFPQIELSTGFQ